MKEKKIYISEDGQTFSTKKAALRRDAEIILAKENIELKNLQKFFEDRKIKSSKWRMIFKETKDVRDVLYNNQYRFEILLKTYKNRFIKKVYLDDKIKKNEFYRDFESTKESVKDLKIEVSEKLKKENKEITGISEDEDSITINIQKIQIDPLDKLKEGIELTEREISDFLWENELVYEEVGEDRRWSRYTQAVIEDEDGNLWCIEYDKGLTEAQDNHFYEQPYRVELEEKEVVVIQTTIKKI